MSASTITPKQQSFVRSLLEERLEFLGITDLEEYIKEKKIESLTGQGASKFIEALKTIPPARKAEHAHLPEGRTIVNKFAKACTLCGVLVDSGKGWAVQTATGWGTYHALNQCGQDVSEDSAPARKPIELEPKRAYRCDDGTIAIAYTTRNGYTAVRRLVIDEDGAGGLEYWQGGTKIVRATGTLLTQEEASTLGKTYGFCICCSKPLSEDQSLAVGYGATCADNNGWYYPTVKEAREILQRPTEVK
jgi:hypothetical protein